MDSHVGHQPACCGARNPLSGQTPQGRWASRRQLRVRGCPPHGSLERNTAGGAATAAESRRCPSDHSPVDAVRAASLSGRGGYPMKLSVRPLCLAALVVAAAGCDDSPPVVDGGPETLDAQLRRGIGQYGPVPIAQLEAQSPALVALGRALMFDKILSGNRDISCGSCHEPSLHATDGLPLAVGTGGTGVGAARTLGPGRSFVPRNAPSLLNSAIGLAYVFWDGRLTRFGPPPPELPFPTYVTNLLVAQAMMPVLNRPEMRGEVDDGDGCGNPNELAQFADTEPTQIWNAVMRRRAATPGDGRMFSAPASRPTPFTIPAQAIF